MRFKIVAYHPITSNNCHNVVPAVLLLYSVTSGFQWNKVTSVLQETGHMKNTIVLFFQCIQCLDLMYSEVALVLVSSGTQIQMQIIFGQDYVPGCLSVSYDYAFNNFQMSKNRQHVA